MTQITVRTVTKLSIGQTEQIKQIYINSFPAPERMDFMELLQAVRDGKKTLFILNDRENIIGFATIRLLTCKPIYFLEYLTITEELRGQGLGSFFFRHIVQEVQSDHEAIGILFEVESPLFTFSKDKQLSERRIEFYRRNGAEIIKGSEVYRMPDLSGKGSLPMFLMWLPLNAVYNLEKAGELKKFIICIYNEIYGRLLDDPLLISILKDLSTCLTLEMRTTRQEALEP